MTNTRLLASELVSQVRTPNVARPGDHSIEERISLAARLRLDTVEDRVLPVEFKTNEN